jgi:hypothetical protein
MNKRLLFKRCKPSSHLSLFIFILCLGLFQSCSKKVQPIKMESLFSKIELDKSTNIALAHFNKTSFLIGETDVTIEKSLEYTCNQVTPAEETQTKQHENEMDDKQFEECLKKLPQSFIIQKELKWDCAQSDRKTIKRPLPDTSELKFDFIFTKRDDQLNSSINLKNWESFLKPSKEGNTYYSICRSQSTRHMIIQLMSDLQAKIEFSCGQKVSDKDLDKILNPVYNHFTDIEMDYETNEKNKILLQPILPYYQDLVDSSLETVTDSELCIPLTDSLNNNDRSLYPSGKKIFSSEFIDHHLEKIIRNGSLKCIYRILHFYLPREYGNEIFMTCLNNPKKDACPIYLERLERLYKKITPYIKQLGEGFDLNLALDPKTEDLSLKLGSFLATSRTTCELLPIGTSKSVFNNFPGTNNKKEFNLVRVEDNTTELKVNVGFKPVCASTLFENKNIAKTWLQRANTCLSNMHPHLKGPDGHFIKLKLISEPENSAPGVNIINVKNDFEGIRANDALYSPLSSCATILHEVLHLTGLVDEYSETKTKDSQNGELASQCRILGPEDSIMRNTVSTIDEVVDHGISLLKPAHYRMLIYPGCKEKNETYTSCASFAYSSLKIDGKCPYSAKNVESCLNGTYDWINK